MKSGKKSTALTQRRLSFKFLRMTRVSVNTKTQRLVPPPHLCIAFLLSPAHSSYKNPKKDITSLLIPAFPGFKNIFIACPGRFQHSKELSSLPRSDSELQKYFRCFPDIFSAFKRTFELSPRRFQASKELSLLPRGIFSLQKNFRAFPEAIPDFKRTFVASPWHFQPSKVFSSLPRSDFGLQKNFRRFPVAFPTFKSIFIACPVCFRTAKALSLLPRGVSDLQKNFRVFPVAISATSCRSEFSQGRDSHVLPAPRPCGDFSCQFLRIIIISRRIFHGKSCETYQQRPRDRA